MDPAAWSKAFGGTKCIDGQPADNTFVVTETVRFLRDSGEARLFRIGDVDTWVPKSQIVSSSDTTLIVTRWLAKERGWV
jgi:hypothetical protein